MGHARLRRVDGVQGGPPRLAQAPTRAGVNSASASVHREHLGLPRVQGHIECRDEVALIREQRQVDAVETCMCARICTLRQLDGRQRERPQDPISPMQFRDASS